ncbi:MFS general substrate transporter [Gymnopus androsaceus JB14]|uniref:MFS general substrate transporter n=1 Tax=Gymnopus androsaceus JB14 TaxID=1447944 RepID=A0A6A4GDE4_9AGAR|nr:MFS general substrate transporter [Gymnopus androsaceus JB14]
MASSKLPDPSDQMVETTIELYRRKRDSGSVLTGKRLAIVFLAMLLSVSLIALDQTILATALPRIASDFDAFLLQGWVAASFLLAQTVFLLLYGQILRIFPSKWVLIASITIFEIGSLVCALAQNVNVLITGRTVSSVGAAGIFITLFQILVEITRLQDRPRLLNIFGTVFAISSVVGPLMGGAFTDHVTWRWCFYINLPIGGVSTLRLDYVGANLVAAAVTCVVLALQWGGNIKPWNDKSAIISSQYKYPHILPGVRHKSATDSGINLIPFMLAVVLSIMVAGQMIGYYTSTTSAQLIGFQILIGVGAGMGLQNSLIAIQTEFKDTPKLIRQATSMASFVQFLGGTIGLGVAEPVLASELSKYLLICAPEAAAGIVKELPTAIYTELPESMIPGVVHAYSLALRIVFVIGVRVAGLALFAAMFLKNIRIVKSDPPAAAGPGPPPAPARIMALAEDYSSFNFPSIVIMPGLGDI